MFPIALYSGHDPWTIPTDVATRIEPTVPSEYIPSFRYYAVIERDIDDETLRRLKGLVAAVIYLEKRGTPEELSAAIDEALTMIADEHGEELQMFVTWLSRMLAKHNRGRGRYRNRYRKDAGWDLDTRSWICTVQPSSMSAGPIASAKA